MTLDLEELERLEREAQWGWGRCVGDDGGWCFDCRDRGFHERPNRWERRIRADLPFLLAELRALRAVAEAAEAHLNERRGYQDSRPLWAALDAWRGSR